MKDEDISQKKIEKSIDYKQELLDFRGNKFSKRETKDNSLKEGEINLNTASLKELIKLPGVGEKTGKLIIDLRTKRNKFRNINELLDVKGIGKTKFDRIKKFIFVE